MAASYFFKICATSWWQHTVAAILTASKPKLIQLNGAVHAKQFFLSGAFSKQLRKVITNLVLYVQLSFCLLGKAGLLVKRFSWNFLLEIFEFVDKFPLW
jgi:hypothetical protein